MTSAAMKTALLSLGIKARIRDCGRSLRVAPVKGEWVSREAVISALNTIHASHGVTNYAGRGFDSHSFNMHEVFVYKPGAIVRI